MQFGFREGVGFTQTLFTILEVIDHIIERGNNVFTYFLDVRKAFDTVWIDGILVEVVLRIWNQRKNVVCLKNLLQMARKPKCFVLVHYSENIIPCKAPGRADFLLPLCIKFT